MSGFGGAVKLTGESEYKRALQTIKQSLKEVSSEMKLATSAFSKNDNSVKALTVKQEGLNKKLAMQKTQLNTLKAQYSAMSSQYDTQTKNHENLVKSYDEEKKELERIGKELGTSSKEYQDQKEKVEALEKEVEKSTKAQDDNEKSMSSLRTEINNAEASIVKTNKELGTLDGKLASAKQAEEKAKGATEQLASSMSDQQKKVDGVKQAYKDAVLQYGKNSSEAQKLGKQLETLSQELAENKKKMSDADRAAEELDKSMGDIDSTTGKIDGGFSVLKGTLANLASAGIQKVVQGMKDLGKSAYSAWQDYDEGADIIIQKTGATGKSAKDLEGVYKRVSKSVNASFEEVGTSVGEVNTRFGSTGKELTSLSTKFLKFAKLNGVDVNTAIDTTQSAMRSWGVDAKDTGKVLDLLNKAGQDTGVSMDTLASDLKKNTPALKEMGFSISDATMFLANLDKNGVDASTTMAGLKKALANASKEGKPMKQAMSEMEKSIKGAKTSTEATQKATELFGAKAGPAIAEAVRSGKLSFKDLGTSLDDFEGNVNKTFENTLDAPDKFALAIQGIRAEMATTVGKLMEKYSPQIESAIKAISKGVNGLFKVVDKVMGFFTKHGSVVLATLTALGVAMGSFVAYTTAMKLLTEGFMAFAKVQLLVTKAQALMNAVMSANPIALVVIGVMALVAGFVVLWKRSEKFRKFWKGLWKDIKKVAMPVIKVVGEAFKTAWDIIQRAWRGAVSFFRNVWDGIKRVFSGVVNYYKTIFTSAWTIIKSVWSVAVSFFTTIWNGIKAVFSAVGTWFKTQFDTAWNGIKTAFSNASSWASTVWGYIKAPFANAGTWFSSKFTSAWSSIKNAFSSASSWAKNRWNDISAPFKSVGSWFKGKFDSAWTNIKNAFKGWGDFWSGLWTKIKNKFGKIGSNIATSIGSSLKSGMNGVISKVESIINKGIRLINKAIDLANKLPGVNVGHVGELSLPRLATGGILKKGQIGLLEGSGAEAVVPLEKNKEWIKRVAEDMKLAISDNLDARQGNGQLNYDSAVEAFKTALNDMQIVLDDDVAGRFVERTVTRIVYA